ncbi:hypothetical protein RF11_01031 [Thelohanellus kitauei]|uniref:Uncharacterized protein n=1 Tax=Thelohanellus kitauei TaxID=669202 RepID=A0A0C2ME54_THEKT|nr:hypothetical protein RF11_01031 [Thelohanellus kitauei]
MKRKDDDLICHEFKSDWTDEFMFALKSSRKPDESNDIFDTAQVAVFVRAINDNFDVVEELLGYERLHSSTKGSDLFETVTNLGENSALKWREFWQFLSEKKEEYDELLLHHEVLSRFLALKNSINMFHSEKDELQTEREFFYNDNWPNDLAFMVDIMSHLNCINERDQG